MVKHFSNNMLNRTMTILGLALVATLVIPSPQAMYSFMESQTSQPNHSLNIPSPVSSLFTSHSAFAIGGTTIDGTTCSSVFGGTWDNPTNTCTLVAAPVTISSGLNMTISSGVTLVIPSGGGISDNGVIINIDSGGTLSNGGTIDNLSNSTIDINSGGIINNLSGGNINNKFGGNINNLSGGIINNSGNIDTHGNGILNSTGTISNSGTINIGPGDIIYHNPGILNINSGGIINNLSGGKIFINGGTININSGGTIDNNSGALIATDFGTINNNSGGTINNNSGGTITNNNQSHINNNGGTIINYGTISNNNVGYPSALVNSGTITNYATISNFGHFANGGTINHVFLSATFSGTGDFTNAGTIALSGTISSDVDLSSLYPGVTNYVISSGTTLTISGGILTIPSGYTLSNSGIINIYGNLYGIDNGGTIINLPGGIINNPSGIITNGHTLNNYGTLTNGHTLNNYGILNNYGTFSTSNILNNQGTINNSGTFNNNSGGGAINNNFGAINNECGATFANNGNLSGSPVNNIACFTPSITAPSTGTAGTIINLNSAIISGIGPFTYSWTLTSPSGSTSTLSSTTMQNPTFTPDIAGDYVLGLTVTDSSSTPQTVTATPATITVSTTACTPGYYLSGNICTPSPAGSYVDTSGATSATLCPAGTYQPNTGQTSCILTPAGTYSTTVGATSASTAIACPPGTFSSALGAASSSTCQLAPAGSYATGPGATSPTLCPAGTFSSADSTHCIQSPAGYYVPTPGTASPLTCPVGDYCPAGAVSPTACPAGATSVAGSASASACTPIAVSTTTDVISSQNPSTFGNTISFTASVTPSTATGNVVFTIDGTPQAPVSLSSGQAVLTSSSLAVGTHSITANYTGDVNDLSSVSSPLTQTVYPAPVTPVITSPSPITTGTSSSASLVPRSGMTYSWAISGGTINGPTAGSSITFTAGSPGTLALSATETNAAGASSAPGTAPVTVVPVPITPVITSPSPITTGQSSSASLPVNPGMTYTWSISGGTITSPGGISGVTSGTTNSITFTAGPPGTISLSAVETNVVGDSSAPGLSTVSVIPIPTTTIVSSSINPSIVGNPVNFTATISPSTATGTVTFSIDGTAQTPIIISDGQASLVTSTLVPGSHSITAAYSGDADDSSSTSSALTQTVNQITTTTTLSSSQNPSILGNKVNFTASITPPTATGTVTFSINGTAQAPVPISSGQAILGISSIATGHSTITAQYNGDTNDQSSTSNTISQIVNKPTTIPSTTTILTSSINPSAIGHVVKFTAKVKPVSPATGTPTGSVTFTIDGTPQTVALSSGTATISTSSLAIGPHTISATYSGSPQFLSSSSIPLVQTVNQGATITAIHSSVNPSLFGHAVKFTAHVSSVAPAKGIPAGTVTFSIDGTPQTVTLSATGRASITISSLSVGSHSISASYIGNANYAGSSSDTITQNVNKAASHLSLSSSQNPSKPGQQVTFTAKVSPNTATGTVTFSVDGTPQTPVSITGGTATFVTSLPAGKHNTSATYSGDATYNSSDAHIVEQIKNKINSYE